LQIANDRAKNAIDESLQKQNIQNEKPSEQQKVLTIKEKNILRLKLLREKRQKIKNR
jgi:hypothetical protein